MARQPLRRSGSSTRRLWLYQTPELFTADGPLVSPALSCSAPTPPCRASSGDIPSVSPRIPLGQCTSLQSLISGGVQPGHRGGGLVDVIRRSSGSSVLNNRRNDCVTTRAWTTDPGGCLVRSDLSPRGGDGDMIHDTLPSLTVPALLDQACGLYGECPAIRYRPVDQPGSPWVTITYAEHKENVHCVARGLLTCGLLPHDIVLVVGCNSVEWITAFLAVIHCGAIATGVYPSTSASSCQRVVNECRAVVAFVEDVVQLEKFLNIMDSCPQLKTIIMLQGDPPEDRRECILVWEELLLLGEQGPTTQEELDRRLQDISPGHCCSVVYTSGTSGDSKPSMMSHDSVTWAVRNTLSVLGDHGFHLNTTDRLVSYLPFSHTSAQFLGVYLPLGFGGCVYVPPWSTCRCVSLLPTTLRDVRPTVLVGLPTVWTTLEAKLHTVLDGLDCATMWVTAWARRRAVRAARSPTHPNCGYAVRRILDRVKRALGLEHCRLSVTQSYPLDPSVSEFFASLNLPIVELYSVTECSGPHTIKPPWCERPSSVGCTIRGASTFVAHTNRNDGELLLGGRHLMMGYLRDPLGTTAAFDGPLALLHTGDAGKVDNEGYVHVSGALVDRVRLSDGEYVFPGPIERAWVATLPAASHVVLIGNDRKYLTVLVALRCTVGHNGVPQQGLCQHVIDDISGLMARTAVDAVHDVAAVRYVAAGMARANAAAPSGSVVQRFSILPEDLSEDSGTLTATGKVRRSAVNRMYATIIDAMYTDVD